MKEQLDILRRIAERLKKDSELDIEKDWNYPSESIFNKYVDYADHLLTEIKYTKRLLKNG